jgi:hypothetical protein
MKVNDRCRKIFCDEPGLVLEIRDGKALVRWFYGGETQENISDLILLTKQP